jgi:hypothetical protein
MGAPARHPFVRAALSRRNMTGVQSCVAILIPPTTLRSERRIGARSAPAPSAELATALRIVISPTKSGRKWIARLGERVLCVSAWPFVKSARLLLNEGYPAESIVELWRPHTDEWALRGRLGAVAATVIDGETVFRAKNGPSAVDTE